MPLLELLYGIKSTLEMRRKIKIPRILKINWIKGLSISVVFNNGESRIIDFEKLLNSLQLPSDSPIRILYQPIEFKKAEVIDHTLSWKNVAQSITMKDGKKKLFPFQIGADTLLAFSMPEKSKLESNLGSILKEQRVKSGLTQQELAMMSGTTRNYISRIENDKSDIELGTLRKIIETGLGKKLKIQVI